MKKLSEIFQGKEKGKEITPHPDFEVMSGTITEYTGDEEEIIIPEELEGETVTGIGRRVFADRNLISVHFPPTLKKIGTEAFANNRLTLINLPGSVTSIGRGAFAENEISDVTLPASLTVLEDKVFYKNKLTQVELPGTLSKILRGAFSSNTLDSVVIPYGVKEIGAWAFSENQLISVSLPDGLVDIGEGAFSENQLKTISLSDSLNRIGESAFAVNKLTSVAIPEGITLIERKCFMKNRLTRVELPDSLLQIMPNAFSSNMMLSKVEIPHSMEAIANNSFDISCSIVHRKKSCKSCPDTAKRLEEALIGKSSATAEAIKKMPKETIAFLCDRNAKKVYDWSNGSGGYQVEELEFFDMEDIKLTELYISIGEYADNHRSRFSERDPNIEKNEEYYYKAVDLVKSVNDYSSEGLLIWIPDLKQFGTADADHGVLYIFDDMGWEEIMKNLQGYVNHQWRDSPINRHKIKSIYEVCNPWEIWGFEPLSEEHGEDGNNKDVLDNREINPETMIEGMYGGDFVPAFLVDKCKDVLIRMCKAIENQKPETLEGLYKITHASTEEINALAVEFLKNGCNIETHERECLAEEFEKIAKAYGFEADLEELIAPREW